jgi:hypothetical protein
MGFLSHRRGQSMGNEAKQKEGGRKEKFHSLDFVKTSKTNEKGEK